jgi:arylsulfatase A-like enzyme
MSPIWNEGFRFSRTIRQVVAATLGLLLAAAAFAQGNSPWENAVSVLQKQKPIEGVSMVYTFDKANANAPTTHHTQYFEMISNRGIYHDG